MKQNIFCESSKSSNTNEEPKKNLLRILTILHYTDFFDRILLSIALLFALISSGLYPTAFWIYGNVVTAFVDYGILKQNSSNLNSSCIRSNLTSALNVEESVHKHIFNYLYFGFPIVLAHFFAYLCWGYAAERTVARLRSKLFSKLIQQDLDWFETFKVEDTNALFMAIEKVRSGTGEKLADFIILMTRALSSVTFGLYSCWKLGLALSSALIISICFFIITIFVGKKYIIKEAALNVKSASIFRHVVNTIRTVLAFAAEEIEIKKYDQSLENIKKVSIRKSLILGLTSGFSSFFNYSSYAIWIGYGTYLFRNECETFTAGNIIQTFSAIIISTLAITQAFPFVKELGEAKIAAAKLFKVLKIRKTVDIFDKTTGVILKPQDIKGNLSFKNVNFHYKSRPENPTIKNFDFKINAGQTVAIIGPSGCGKSTLIKLIARLFSSTSGQIDFDGHNINDFNLNWWRTQLSIVSQEPVLLNMSFRENIRLGNTEATDQEVEQAAKAADIHSDILAFKTGYDTIIEHGGSRLSGGQRQRISIARAFLRSKANLLIFDEATSALDNETEKHIQNSINRLRIGKTTIIIAHRLSTIRNADVIIEMKNGSINDFGSHDDLVKKQGYYYSLIKDCEEESSEDEENQQNIIKPTIKKHLSLKNKFSIKREQNLIEEDNEAIKDENYSFKVWSMNKQEIGWIILASVAFFLNGCVYPFVAFSFSEMVKIFTILDTKQNFEQTYTFTGIVIALSIVSFIATFLINYASAKSGLTLTTRAKSLLFKKIVYKPIEWFDKEDNKLSKLTYGMANYPSLLKGYTAERLGLILNFLTGVGIPVGMSFYYSWKLTLVVLIFVPIALIWGFMQGQGIRNNRKRSGLNRIDDAVETSREIVQNIQTIMINNLQVYFKIKLDKQFKSNLTRMFVIILIESIFYGLGYALFFFVQCAAFGYGSSLIQIGELEPSNAVRIFASMLFSSMFLGKTISTLADIPKAKKAAKWVFNIIDNENDEDLNLNESFSRTLDNFKGDIVFDKVKFGYANRNRIALDNLNIKFINNKSYALVGKSGCGKSTIMSLILKYYTPSSGRILIDGVDLNTINTRWYRKQIGLVSQEFNLFDGTVLENITYGLDSKEYTESDVINAAIQADAHEFINKLPQGYDTVLINGGTLSGGQKQRISLARALIRKPKILLLDEATSALDKESESRIQQTIEKTSRNRTCISVTHRLNTIENCDKIFVINNKTVAENGSHQELMNLKGYYYMLKQSEFST